jgi:hypothetical protein
LTAAILCGARPGEGHRERMMLAAYVSAEREIDMFERATETS